MLRRLAPEYVKACRRVDEAESRLREVREAIQAQRIKQRTKTPKGIESLKTEAKDLRAQLKELRAARKAAKQASYDTPAVRAGIESNNDRHKHECRIAKAESGLYWGTEAIIKQACASFASGAPPRFKRFDGTGQVAVQLQGGLDCEHATRANTLCFLDPDSRDGKLIDCYFRIGSDGREPIFAKARIVMHRALPDGKIKWGYLEKRKVANHVRWTLRLTIDCEGTPVRHGTDRWCAIHVGWSRQHSGLRAAIWQGCDGKQGAVTLSNEHLRDYERLDNLRSKRDQRFNEMRDRLAEWIDGRDVPEWMSEARKHMGKWRSPQRMAKLILQWRDDRFDGDDDEFHVMDAYRKEDKHLWQNERRLSLRVVRRRTDLYRKFAHQLSQEYGVVYVGKVDAKELTENSEPEDLERDNTQAHRQAKWAAVSDLIRMVEEKFPLRAIAVDTKNLSRQCCECGHVNPQNKPKIQCTGQDCGRTYLSDENALGNTIARGEAAQHDGALLELKRQQRDKEIRAAEKLAKMQQARREKTAARKQAS
jgi:hypothetical protein